MAHSVSLALTGDVMLGRLVNDAMQRFGAAYPWGDTVPMLRDADLRIVNLECVLATGGRPWSRWHKAFRFRADPILGFHALQVAGIDCVTLANNHVLDYEEEALLEMLESLECRRLPYAGAGRNNTEARRAAIVDASGLWIGVVACTDNEPGWAATAATPGTNYLPISLAAGVLAQVRAAIEAARASGADLVIVSLHWGPNMVQRPSPRFQAFAHALVDAGADVVCGHSAHLFQGIEIYRRRPILYDLGDCVDDYAIDPQLHNDWSILPRLHATREGIQRIEIQPMLIAECQVNLASGAVHHAIAARLRTLSAEMGTSVQQDGEQVWIDCTVGQHPDNYIR
jgi:poly-gamma-glutamate synthesis protein (capsule biosynthesis protein)